MIALCPQNLILLETSKATKVKKVVEAVVVIVVVFVLYANGEMPAVNHDLGCNLFHLACVEFCIHQALLWR